MLLMLAKRSSAKRDQIIAATAPSKISDIEMINPSTRRRPKGNTINKGPDKPTEWTETGWCHPAAQSSRKLEEAIA